MDKHPIKESKGIGCCHLNRSNQCLFNTFFIIAILFLVPFAVVDLIFAWRLDINECMDQVWPRQHISLSDYNSFNEQERGKFYDFSSMSLRQWMYDDGYIKTFMAGIALFFFLLRKEAYEHRRLLLSAFGILFQLYWLFEIGWLVSTAVKFWRFTEKSTCPGEFRAYMWPRLIVGFILCFIGLIIYSFRSKDRDYFHSYHPSHLNNPHDNLMVLPPTERQMVN